MKFLRLQKQKKEKVVFGIKYKLIGVSLIPVLFIIVLGMSSYQKAADAIISNYETSTHNTIVKAGEYYSLLFTSLERTSLEYYTNEEIIKYYSGAYAKKANDEKKIYVNFYNKLIAESRSNEFLAGIHIISQYGDSVSSLGKISKEQLKAFSEKEEGKSIFEQNGKAVWLGAHPYLDEITGSKVDDYGISINRTIKSTNMKDIAVLSMDVKKSELTKTIQSMEFPEGSFCAVVTPDGREITTPELEGKGTFIGKEYFYDRVKGSDANGIDTVLDNGKKYLFVFAKIGESQNIIACLIPENKIMEQANDIKKFTITMVIIASAVAIFVSFLIASGISKAIYHINKVTKQAAEGDLTGVVKSKRGDELGKLSGHMTDMLDDMKGLISHVASITDMVFESTDYVANNSEQIVDMARQISDAVENIETGVNEQSTQAQRCKDKMDELSGLIGVVVESTEMIDASSRETRSILATGVKTIEELEENVKNTTQITNEAIIDMEALSKESQKIGTITNAMNEIADQTNLLALNASIEAARAGSAGRGFSVVADEIRKLAEESVKASSQINEIIASIEKNMKNTVGAVRGVGDMVRSQEESLGQTVSAFEAINMQMDHLNQNIEKITSNVKVMDDAKENTTEAIENISVVLEQTAASSTQVLASVGGQVEAIENFDVEIQKLKLNSSLLRDSISIFKVE